MTLGIGTLLIGLALLVIVVVLVLLPLLEPKSPLAQPASQRDALEAERAAIVRSIRDLDFDYRTHKLNEPDYRVLRQGLVQRGADVLRELEALNQTQPAPDTVDDDAAVDAQIEAAVLALRRGEHPAARVSGVAHCPACGHPVLPDDRFCAKCGHALRVHL